MPRVSDGWTPPWTLHRARLKPVQLAIAARIGINVPHTLVTGDPVAAAAFAPHVAPLAKSAVADHLRGDHD